MRLVGDGAASPDDVAHAERLRAWFATGARHVQRSRDAGASPWSDLPDLIGHLDVDLRHAFLDGVFAAVDDAAADGGDR